MLLFPQHSPFHLRRFIIENGVAQGKNIFLCAALLKSGHWIREGCWLLVGHVFCVARGWRTEEGGEVINFFLFFLVYCIQGG